MTSHKLLLYRVFNKMKKSKFIIFISVIAIGVIGLRLSESIYLLFNQVGQSFFHARIEVLSLAFALCLLYQVINSCSWGIVLKQLGENIDLRNSSLIWLTSESCRWLPGSLWGYASRGFQARQASVTTKNIAASISIELLLTIFSWAFLAIPFILFSPLLSEYRAETLLLLSASVAIILFFKRFQRNILKQFLSFNIVKKYFSPLTSVFCANKYPLKTAYKMLVYFILVNALNGLAFLVLTNAFSIELTLIEACGINAISWLVGFFAIFAPGGLGVREATGTLLLSYFTSSELALAAFVSWRLLQVLVEFSVISLVLFLKRLPQVFESIRLVNNGLRGSHYAN